MRLTFVPDERTGQHSRPQQPLRSPDAASPGLPAALLSQLEEGQEQDASTVAQAILAYSPIIEDPSENERLAWIVFAWLMVNGLLPLPTSAKTRRTALLWR